MQFTSSLRRAGRERSIFSAHSSIWANAYILVRSMREKNNARYLQLTTDNLKFVFRGNLPDRNLGTRSSSATDRSLSRYSAAFTAGRYSVWRAFSSDGLQKELSESCAVNAATMTITATTSIRFMESRSIRFTYPTKMAHGWLPGTRQVHYHRQTSNSLCTARPSSPAEKKIQDKQPLPPATRKTRRSSGTGEFAPC